MIKEPQRDLPFGFNGAADVFDDLIILQSEFFPVAIPHPSNLKRWTGTAWVSAELKRWNGNTWVPAQLQKYSGSAWLST